MKELYSIGEVAGIMGISVQTLRNYANSELLKPQYIDEKTGYRYYSFKQFHMIDRIRYLRSLNMPLSEIEEVMKSGNVDGLSEHLALQKNRIASEIEELQGKLDDIQWYEKYFAYMKDDPLDGHTYKITLPERYAIFEEYKEGDTVETIETRLAILKHRCEAYGFRYLRQYGFVVDCQDLLQKKLIRKRYITYLKEKPEHVPACVMVLPAGEYLCFRGRICTENWNPHEAAKQLKNNPALSFAVANEYEDNLAEYKNCPYEVQILTKRTDEA